MSKIYTCEQVSNGHPDKICDQIADAVVTDCLQHDKDSRVAIECLLKNHRLVIVLWSSFFVTLVAKKYRLATMLPFVPRMVCDSR